MALENYRPLTAEILSDSALELWILADDHDLPVGFLGLAGHSIEALFLEPASRRQGGGCRLVAHAQQLRGSPLTVDVTSRMSMRAASIRRLDLAWLPDRHTTVPGGRTRSSICDANRPGIFGRASDI